jgi:RNA polymerase sigma-70 factor, ECF subfamily
VRVIREAQVRNEAMERTARQRSRRAGQPHDPCAEGAIRAALDGGDTGRAAVELVRRYAGEIRRFCTHAIGSPLEGEDLAQEVLGEACRSLPGFRGHSTIRTWLYRVAWHKVYDQRKRFARQPRVVPLDGLEGEDVPRCGGDAPDEALAGDEQRRLLGQALRQLSHDDRTIIALRVEQDLPYQEIAGLLGVREGAAKMRMNRAVRRLQEQISEVEPDARSA